MKDKRKGNILLLLSEYDKIDIEIKGFSRGSIPLEYRNCQAISIFLNIPRLDIKNKILKRIMYIKY